jgi:V8-like Glu-specific endopeptidase
MQKKSFFVLLFAAASAVAFQAKSETTPDRSTALLAGTHEVFPIPEGQPRQEVLDFWTEARMKAAWTRDGKQPAPPPEGEVITPDGDESGYALMPVPYAAHELSRMTGILFFRIPHSNSDKEELKHCSASVIHSTSGNLILTAAHCFFQPNPAEGDLWHDMAMFVPAYRQGEDGSLDIPFEKWPIQQGYFPYEGAERTIDDDIAVARVYSEPGNIGPDKTLEEVVGNGFLPRVYAGGNDFPMVKIIGYPGQWMLGDEPYDRAEQRQCDSETAPPRFGETAFRAINCAPQGGNSGGPVIVMDGNPFVHEVIGVFTNIPATNTRLLPNTFLPIYNAANVSVSP